MKIETGDKRNRVAFLEDLLFTHRGLSGPGVLQISSYWQPGLYFIGEVVDATGWLGGYNFQWA